MRIVSNFMSLSERLEKAARKADEIGLELSSMSNLARKTNDEGVASLGRLALLMHSASAILRAGIDPAEVLREEMISERNDRV